MNELARLTVIAAAWFCAWPTPVRGHPGELRQLVVVISSAREEYESASRELMITLADNSRNLIVEKRLYQPGAAGEKSFWEDISSKKPSLIITVGTPSSRSAITNIKNIPLVCSMILGELRPEGTADKSAIEYAGVSLSIPYLTQLKILSDALPTVRRIGLLSSPATANKFESVRATAQSMGLRLVDCVISSDREISAVLERLLPQIEVLWVPPDDRIYSGEALRYILQQSYSKSVAVMAFSRQMAEAGAALSIGFDYEDIGRQTAELVLEKLSAAGAGLQIVPPRSVVLYINEPVAAGLGLHIPRNVLENAVILGKEQR